MHRSSPGPVAPSRRSAILLALAGLLSLAACGEAPPPEPAPGPRDRDAAPVLDPAGLGKLFDGLSGHLAVVNLWATWCVPCTVELPELEAFAREAGQDVKVVALSVDEPEKGPELVRAFFKKGAPSFRVAILGADAYPVLRERLVPGWDGSLPTTVVLARDGRVAARLVGPQKRDQLAAALRSAR